MIESYNDFPVLIIKKPGEQQMKRLICLILMGVLTAQNSSFGESQLPKMTSPFEIDYLDLPYPDTSKYKGKVLVKFIVDERGKVINPEIIDTFDIELNDAIIDRVMAIKFNPAKQNGRPVRVQYNLPILFQ
tara:strand:+ start:253 stop:645 length:393 start_codon:yes stop_codon:yes gene_type:complete